MFIELNSEDTISIKRIVNSDNILHLQSAKLVDDKIGSVITFIGDGYLYFKESPEEILKLLEKA